MKKSLFSLILLLLFITSGIQAQITIGSTNPPTKGALLDLKQNSNLGANSEKGLLLSRVGLVSRTALYPMYTTKADTLNVAYKEAHTGLVVYNVNKYPLCPGLFVWTGTEWEPLHETCSPFIQILDPSSKILDFSGVSTPQKVEFKTNSDWTFTPLNSPNNYSDLIASQDKTPSITYTGGTTSSVVTDFVNFTPVVNNTNPAGTILETQVKFETTGNGGSEDSDILTIKSVTPSIFNITNLNKASGSELLVSGDVITFDVETNDAFEITTNLSSSPVFSKTKANKQTYPVTVTIPAYTTGAAGSQQVIDIYYTLNGTKVKIATYYQTLPMIKITTPATKTIDFGVSATAETVTLSTNSSWLFTYLNTPTTSNNVVTASSNTAGTTYTGGTLSSLATPSLTFTPNTSDASPAGTVLETQVKFETTGNGGNEDSDILTLKRTVPSTFKITNLSKASGSEVFADGDQITFNVETNDAFEIYSTQRTTKIDSKAKANKQTYTITVPIDSYSGAANSQVTITLSYVLNGVTHTIASYIQKAPYTRLVSSNIDGKIYYRQAGHSSSSPYRTTPVVVIESNLGQQEYTVDVYGDYWSNSGEWINLATFNNKSLPFQSTATKTYVLNDAILYGAQNTNYATRYRLVVRLKNGTEIPAGRFLYNQNYFTVPGNDGWLVDLSTSGAGVSQPRAIAQCQAKGWMIASQYVNSAILSTGGATIYAWSDNTWLDTAIWQDGWGVGKWYATASDKSSSTYVKSLETADNDSTGWGFTRCYKSNNLTYPSW